MDWKKKIIDVIDDTVSRMELLSEVIGDEGHIVVYIKNDMANYCPYVFHIVYDVYENEINIDTFYSVSRMYASGDKTDLYILFASSMGIILKTFFNKLVLVEYEEHPVCDNEFAGAYIAFCEGVKNVSDSELKEKVGLLFESYIMAMHLHYKVFGTYGMNQKELEDNGLMFLFDKVEVHEECEREDYRYKANLNNGMAMFDISEQQYNPNWILTNHEYEIIDGVDGKIVVQQDIGGKTYNFISQSDWNKVKQIVPNLNGEGYSLVCQENMLYLLTMNVVWIVAGEYYHYWVENEKEKMIARQINENEFLFMNRDFKWKYPIDPSRFEELIADLVETEPRVVKTRLMGKSNNSDGGRDILIYKTMYKDEQRMEYLVIGQCKAYEKSVNKKDVTDIRDMLDDNGARGFFLAVSSQATVPLIDVLRKIGEKYEVDWWTEREIFQRLRRNSYLVERYKDILEIL